MLRFAVSLLVGLFFFGSASAQIVTDPNAKTYGERLRELQARLQAKINAEVAAARIPAARLNEAQIAKLRAVAPNDRVAWYGAGRQSDGKTFVCLVTDGKTLFGESRALVFAGTFESDGSYQRPFLSGAARPAVNECRKRGFDPPVAPKRGLRF